MELAAIIVWIALATAVAALAERKGRPFELFLSLSVLLSPAVGLLVAWLVRPTEKALIESGRAWRCACGHLARAPQRACPSCAAPRPPEAIAVEAEAESWSFLGRLLLGIAIVFGGLTFFSLALTWLRRTAP